MLEPSFIDFLNYLDYLDFSKYDDGQKCTTYFRIGDAIRNYNLYTGSAILKTKEIAKSTIVFDFIFKLYFNNYSQRDFNIVLSYFYEILGRLFYFEKVFNNCYINIQNDFFSLISNLNNEEINNTDLDILF